MRRLLLRYVLIPAVLLATAGLAYYSYTQSVELSEGVLDTTRELAAEKIAGIESELIRADRLLFESVRLDSLRELEQRINEGTAHIESVLVLDDKRKILPGGFFTKRTSKEDIDALRTLFETRVVEELALDAVGLNQRGHLYRAYDGRPYLFSFTRRLDRGSTFYVVVVADLSYLFDTVFRYYFTAESAYLYQIVGETGEHRFGFDFAARPDEVVELGFPETLTGWRLRVVQKQDLGRARDTRRLLDLGLIGTAMLVILAGLGVLLWAERRERRANQLKSDFISNVSHELKTPLSIISMFGEMLAMGRTKSPEQAAEYAGIIRRESVRLSRLIDNVLDFSKIERGIDVYEFAEGDLGQVVERGLDVYRHRLEREGMALEVDIEAGLPAVRMDDNALTLALLNLVDNAIKYAAAGKRLEISLRRRGDRLALVVRDHGPGIPPEERARIFERFYRGRTTRLKPVRGSGIGLALVKHIAAAHGGTVEVTSEVDAGTTFTLTVPVPA